MKIRKVILENNKIFGNRVEFDFIDMKGDIVDNIVLIGENGTGKTNLLEIIYKFSDYSIIGDGNINEKRIFEIEFSDNDIKTIQKYEPLASFNMKVCAFTFDCNKSDWNQVAISDRFGAAQFSQVKTVFKTIYSPVAINFIGRQPEGSTDQELDKQVLNSQRAPTDLSTHITQLLIDIRSRDNETEIQYYEKNKTHLPEDKRQIRIKRFQNAFNKVFDNKLSFVGVEGKEVVFSKNSKFNINNLSSGEKQIVYRGGFLLRDIESIKGAPVLIDEPEISLHPIRQLKIFSYYRDLFLDIVNGEQTSQIFASTHSPYVFKALNDINHKIFIFKRDNSTQNITVSTPILGIFGNTPTRGEINYTAFDLPTIEFHDDLYGYIQNITQSFYEESIEDIFIKNGLTKSHKRTREKKGIIDPKFNNYDVTLQTFIRNRTHHPENSTMQSVNYGLNDLTKSIEQMLIIVSKIKDGTIVV